MGGPLRRMEAAWLCEGQLFMFAIALVAGTLAWEGALHSLILSAAPAEGSVHLVRDALLLMPLALVVAWWGAGSARLARAGLPRAAACASGAFAALLAPAAAAHTLVHGADGTTAAQAAGRSGHEGAMAGEGEGPLEILVHGLSDAALALPAAFLISLAALAVIRRRGGGPATPRFRRRLLLIASTAVLAAGAALVPTSSAVSPDYVKFAAHLKVPPILDGAEINIEMVERQVQILPGNPTTMWTYNGSFPGPVIRRPTGVPTKVTFANNLPESAGSTTVHHHGAQTTEDSDGHPSRYLVPPGSSRTYTYPAIDNGVPERAAPQWYHDHRDMVTGRNVWRGLAGGFIYEDPFERALDLPSGEHDVPLFVADREFDADNQLVYVFNPSGNMGDVILVNGAPQPHFEVGDRRYRFRLFNISNKRDYVFRLSNGMAMTQIGTEAGLLPAPVPRTSIRLGPAERADVVIDFAGHLNENIVLENGDAANGPGERDAEVMQFRVNEDVTDDSSPVPSSLRPLPSTGAPVVTRTWDFDRVSGAWTINGKPFDPDRVDAQTKLGTTERWVFRNPTVQAHLVHVHLGDQKLVSRNGQPPPPGERLKETWYLAPNEEVVVDVKFSDHVGTFVFHCHVLEHEDDAMMSQFQTLAAPRPPTTPPTRPRPAPTIPAALSFRVKILSSKRLARILRRGLRFEAASPAAGTTLRAALTVRGRRVGSLRRTNQPRGRVKLTMKLSRRGRARLRRAMAGRRRARAVLTVKAGNTTARGRFTIRR